jgi:hypothetical protein
MLISQASSERMLQDNETAQDKQEKSLAQRVTAYQIKKVLEINKQTNKLSIRSVIKVLVHF